MTNITRYSLDVTTESSGDIKISMIEDELGKYVLYSKIQDLEDTLESIKSEVMDILEDVKYTVDEMDGPIRSLCDEFENIQSMLIQRIETSIDNVNNI